MTVSPTPPQIPAWTQADQDLADFANQVQAWSIQYGLTHTHYGTFGDAASALKVSVERIAEAVEWHYWMFTHDTDEPLAMRRIEHDGE